MRRLHASPDLGSAMCDEVPGTPPHRQKRQCVGRDWKFDGISEGSLSMFFLLSLRTSFLCALECDSYVP